LFNRASISGNGLKDQRSVMMLMLMTMMMHHASCYALLMKIFESANTNTINNNNSNNAIYIAQIRTQQQIGCRMVSVQTERLSAQI